MLLLPKTGQVAPMLLRISKDDPHHFQCLLAHLCQFVHTVSLTEHIIGDIKPLTIFNIARAVTPIMRDIERHFSFRSWRQNRQCSIRIDTVVTGRKATISLDDLESLLSMTSGNRQPQ